MTAPRAVSLFSGCGAADLGLLNAGFDVVFANDIWPPAVALYRANLPTADVVCGDVRDIAVFPAADLLIGCYPCQGFSQGGARKSSSSVNYLYREFDRALRQVRPKAFIVENVAGMAYGGNRVLLHNQLVRFRLAGYAVRWRVLDAKDYGLGQTRKRLFMVGLRSDLGLRYSFPEATHGPGRRRSHRTQRDEIGEMPIWPEGQFCAEPFHWYYLSRRRRHNWDEPSPCVVGHWRHVPLHPMSPPLVRIDTDHWKFADDGPARRLSLAECARLQGFRDSYRWEGARLRDAFRAAGNALPSVMVSTLASALPEVW